MKRIGIKVKDMRNCNKLSLGEYQDLGKEYFCKIQINIYIVGRIIKKIYINCHILLCIVYIC